ncbi:hypothetical protein PHYSODRAFT_480264 [Phytophthora sojae]|uniref:EcxA zinc-binding domain-containing protein n=1 Tax=Phytophthora sojae (strain P6497) TaxID=1094619 RepID=G4YU57_PHYSP|nr:hypothetical protein PHYSODRAFT_480264 [Phytophthora sojae]EGZ23612.1 hypothetical protein PHYSODRAFT_480264 [Phytophthora sojae]|eukprot:XP_009518900.1 hypothetical protein PHYSODRAFT_480264 [Phytophthora sojae]
MAQVIDSPRFRIDSDSDEEIDIELGARQDPTSEAPAEQNLEHDTASLLGPERRSKRVRTAILTVSFLFLLGVSIGLAARFSREQPASINSGTEVQNGDVVPFLDVQFTADERSVFVLSKTHWNSSFIVYPTVVRRAAPVKTGLERGGILLETNDFAFHFELSPSRRYLQLVQEYHYASLRRDKAEELQQMFDDSQWPGYVTKVPIYAETDSAYYIPSDVFLSNGFFVSSQLASSDFTALEKPSESFERNTMLFVEYELASGVIEVNYAIGLLPDEVMPQRVADDRIGYFAKRFTQYSIQGQELSDGNGYHWWDPQVTVIHRRKLELDATRNTTKHPIAYYIDPSVPPEWREAFATGVEAWVPAFERIGFPNAIRAVLPGDDDWPADYRLGDLRFNSISVMISKETYAYGPTVIDPRSGEILHSDIVFEYGFFNEVISDFDMKSPTDPPQSRRASTSSINDDTDTTASAKTFTHVRAGRNHQCGIAREQQHQLDRIMLRSFAADGDGYVPKKLIAQHFAGIVMHEVGHTLGLRHNFAGSTAYSRDQLRDPEFVAEHGLSTSIMDYLPVNIFSDLTQDEVGRHPFYMTAIGAYDYAAIAYGYSITDDEVPGYKHPHLTELAAAAPLFLTDEAVENMLNPYAQRFDLSSDLVDYAADRLQLVKNARSSDALLNKLPDDASSMTLWQRERILLRIIEQAIRIVRPMLGGVNVTHAHRVKDEGPYNATFVSRDTQLEALDLLLRAIEAESGLFPEPKDYGLFMEVVGFDKGNCNEATLDYDCLGRGLVDVGGYVLNVRGKALVAALFPAMDRIVQQDVLSPLTLEELLDIVFNTLNNHLTPTSDTLYALLDEILRNAISNRDTDARVKKAIEKQWGVTEPPAVVVVKPDGEGK